MKTPPNGRNGPKFEKKEEDTSPVNYVIDVFAKKAESPKIHPYILRDSYGYYLANKGYNLRLIQNYSGCRNPEHTVIYTQVAGSGSEEFW